MFVTWQLYSNFPIVIGESLEAACQREVEEEVGVQLSEVLYHSSQPWPTPSTLMLGFIGYAKQLPLTVSLNKCD